MTKLIRKAKYGMIWSPEYNESDLQEGNFLYTNLGELFNTRKDTSTDITGITLPTNTNTSTNLSTLNQTESSLNNFRFSGNTKSRAEVCKACYLAFRNAGATDAAAKGILANIMYEGNFDPGVFGWDGNEKKGKFGIGGGLFGFFYHGGLPKLAQSCGWSKEKLDQLNEQVKNSGLPLPRKACSNVNRKYIKLKFGDFPFTLEQQLNYIVKTNEFLAVKNYTDPSKAAWYWMKNYEKPANLSVDRWAKAKDSIAKLLS